MMTECELPTTKFRTSIFHKQRKAGLNTGGDKCHNDQVENTCDLPSEDQLSSYWLKTDRSADPQIECSSVPQRY